MKKPGELTHVEFRTECEPPTEPGWYWAEYGYEGIIEPTRVTLIDGELHGDDLPLKSFSWYGPITPVRRAP